MRNEPVLNAALLVAVTAAAIQLFIAFGLPLSVEQIQAITGFVTVVAPLVIVAIARKKVTPVSNPKDSDGTPLTRVEPEVSEDGEL